MFTLQVDPSSLPTHLTPAGTFLDAAGAVQVACCPASPGSPVQPVQVFSVGDQLPQEIPDPGLHMLPGTGTSNIPGPLQLGSLEASHQFESGNFPDMHARMTQLSGYHENSSTEPVVVVPEYQQHQQHQYQAHNPYQDYYQYQEHRYPGQQGQWYSWACSPKHDGGLFLPGMHLSDLSNQPVTFVDDHVADTTIKQTTETPGDQAAITNAHRSTVVHEATPRTNKLPEVSRRVPQQPTASAPAQEGAKDSDDDQEVVVIEERSTPGRIRLPFFPKVAVQPNLPSNHAAQISPLNVSTNSRPEQQVELVKPVKESHPTRFDKHYPVAGARCDTGVSRCFGPVMKSPNGTATGECRRDLHDAEIPENILASFAVGVPSFLHTLSAASVAEELEKIDNSGKPSRDMQRDEQVLPSSYDTQDNLALSLQGAKQCIPNAPCATAGMMGVLSSSPSTRISNDNRKKTWAADDEIEITYDSTDARFQKRSASTAQDERVSRKLVEMLNPPNLAEFNSDIALDRSGMNHLADLGPLMSTRDILTSGSPPSRAMWETEEVIKLMSVSLESDHKCVGGVVTQYTACTDEKRPLASTLSPPTTGSKVAKKRKLSEVHEVLPDSPPESDSSEPNHKKCCFREEGLGEIRRVHSGPSTGDLTKPCARFLHRLDGQYKPGKYAKKLKASKERKSTWA